MSDIRIDLQLPLPEGAPERLKGSAAWMTPVRMTVHGRCGRGDRGGQRTWLYVTVVGYTPGTTTYARGQYGAALVKTGAQGRYHVPEDPWLVIPADIVGQLLLSLGGLAEVVDQCLPS